MRKIEILVPEGWLVKFVCYLVALFAVLVAVPYYRELLRVMDAQLVVEQARAQVEANKILGQCK